MNSESEELSAQIEEARQVALDIDEGSRSRYWNLLKKKIDGWMAVELKHLELLNARLIRTDLDVEERNDLVKRIALLKQFSTINEIVRDENLAIINAWVVPEIERFKRPSSFVGNQE